MIEEQPRRRVCPEYDLDDEELALAVLLLPLYCCPVLPPWFENCVAATNNDNLGADATHTVQCRLPCSHCPMHRTALTQDTSP